VVVIGQARQLNRHHQQHHHYMPPLRANRIAQEALANIAKHSKAKQVEVRLSRSDSRVYLVVSDDGVGFNPDESGKSGGLGLINMRERVRQLNGTFEFESEAGCGTTAKAD
jgi:signal transduction histidine kinase